MFNFINGQYAITLMICCQAVSEVSIALLYSPICWYVHSLLTDPSAIMCLSTEPIPYFHV